MSLAVPLSIILIFSCKKFTRCCILFYTVKKTYTLSTTGTPCRKNDKLLHDARVCLLQNHHLPYNVKTADYILIIPNTG